MSAGLGAGGAAATSVRVVDDHRALESLEQSSQFFVVRQPNRAEISHSRVRRRTVEQVLDTPPQESANQAQPGWLDPRPLFAISLIDRAVPTHARACKRTAADPGRTRYSAHPYCGNPLLELINPSGRQDEAGRPGIDHHNQPDPKHGTHCLSRIGPSEIVVGLPAGHRPTTPSYTLGQVA